jgi:HSP20 family protein
MAIVRWEPARDLATMEIDRLNRMFASLYADDMQRGGWMPPVDIFETGDHEVIVKAELPDMKREDVNITFENNVLTIRGERRFETEVARERYQRVERQYGAFSRSFNVPASVDASRISAALKDGVLTIRLPQRDDAKPKQITVGE